MSSTIDPDEKGEGSEEQIDKEIEDIDIDVGGEPAPKEEEKPNTEKILAGLDDEE